MTDSEDYSINANLTALPDRVGVDGLEAKWRKVWDEDGTYTFHDPGERKAVYSIDTPPPTVSGTCTSVTCSRTRIPTSSPGSSA